VSLTLTQELYASGQAGRYGPNHRVQLDAKQAAERLIFYPYTLLEDMFVDKWPDRLILREEPVEIDPSAILRLGPFARPLYALEQSMLVNYLERERIGIEAQFGKNPDAWPSDWNFARVVRNSVAHKNAVFFNNPAASPVSWRGLVYCPADNGRRVMNGDLWAADLICLMMDLDAHLS